MNVIWKQNIVLLQIIFLLWHGIEVNSDTDVASARRNPKAPKREGLYSASDDVQIVNNDNIKDLVYGKDTAWMIEFYNSWCGHCIHFAPTWKSLATDLRGWRKVISVGAIDCSTGENLRVCRRYGIVAYPSIVLIPPYSSINTTRSKVKVMRTQQKKELKRAAIDFISEPAFPVPPAWPTLKPLRSVGDIWRRVKWHHKLVAVVFEEQHNTVATEVILDLSDYEDILVRRMKKEDVKEAGTIVYPSVYLVHKDSSFHHLISGTGAADSDRRRFVDKILSVTGHLDGEGHRKKEDGHHDDQAGENGDPDIHNQQSNDNFVAIQQVDKTPRVYSQDLESTLTYAFRQEVAIHSTIQGDALNALTQFVTVLVKYFPGRARVMGFLQKLAERLTQSNTLSGEQWVALLDSLQDEESSLPSNVNWISCQGSRPRYRGYPCGLWTLFHTLTVAAHQSDIDINAQEVPLAIRGYVTHFFGCQECKEHFLKRALNLEAKIHNSVNAILWLWLTHNKANLRLRGDVTEDPQHPKFQFPSAEACPKCRPEEDAETGSVPWWNSSAVVAFLVKLYGKKNIISASTQEFDKIDNKKEETENGRVDGNKNKVGKNKIHHENEMATNKIDNEKTKDDKMGDENEMDWWQNQRKRAEETRWKRLHESARGVGWGMALNPDYMPMVGGIGLQLSSGVSGVDVGVYFAFYVVSGIILIILYLQFVANRRSKNLCSKCPTL